MLILRHVDLKWSEGSGRSAFMGGVSPVLYRLVVLARPIKISAGVQFSAPAQFFTISCEKSKILSRLPSVLSLHRKFVHDHFCCPNSATILTDSYMGAVLEFGRGCQDLAIILLGGCGKGGGRKWDRRLAAPVIAFEGGSEKGGVRREEGEQICPCTKCSHVHVVSTLSLFLISLFCCCSLSRYKKVPQEQYRSEVNMFICKNLNIEAKRRKLTLTCVSSERSEHSYFQKSN
jgi:hypothetical protein